MDTRDEAVSVEEKTLVRWHLAKRVAFRFAFAYFILFSFPGLYEPHSELISQVAPNLIPGVAARALHLPIPTGVYTRDEALSDSIFGTSRTLLLLAIAFAVTAIWTVLDRKRLHYQRLFDWLTLYLRMFVGVSVLGYGAAKLVPTQMRDPTLITLMAPFGNLSPTSLLWSFMGSSKPYTIFAGTVETLGALLMFVPRATTLASLICAAALANVFMLDLSYDVGVKQFSLHLLLMSFFLLAPDAGRLTDALLFHRGIRLDLCSRPHGSTLRHLLFSSFSAGITRYMRSVRIIVSFAPSQVYRRPHLSTESGTFRNSYLMGNHGLR